MALSQLEVGIATTVYCSTERERQRGHRGKLYSDAYGKYLMMTVAQLIGNFGVYADFQVGKKFCTTLDRDISKRSFTSSTKEKHLVQNGY